MGRREEGSERDGDNDKRGWGGGRNGEQREGPGPRSPRRVAWPVAYMPRSL